jgi:hypothetical protein
MYRLAFFQSPPANTPLNFDGIGILRSSVSLDFFIDSISYIIKIISTAS